MEDLRNPSMNLNFFRQAILRMSSAIGYTCDLKQVKFSSMSQLSTYKKLDLHAGHSMLLMDAAEYSGRYSRSHCRYLIQGGLFSLSGA